MACPNQVNNSCQPTERAEYTFFKKKVDSGFQHTHLQLDVKAEPCCIANIPTYSKVFSYNSDKTDHEMDFNSDNRQVPSLLDSKEDQIDTSTYEESRKTKNDTVQLTEGGVRSSQHIGNNSCLPQENAEYTFFNKKHDSGLQHTHLQLDVKAEPCCIGNIPATISSQVFGYNSDEAEEMDFNFTPQQPTSLPDLEENNADTPMYTFEESRVIKRETPELTEGGSTMSFQRIGNNTCPSQENAEYTFFNKKLDSGFQHTHVQLDMRVDPLGAGLPRNSSSDTIGYDSGKDEDVDITFSPFQVRHVDAPVPDSDEDKFDTAAVMAAMKESKKFEEEAQSTHTPESDITRRHELQQKIYSSIGSILTDVKRQNSGSSKFRDIQVPELPSDSDPELETEDDLAKTTRDIPELVESVLPEPMDGKSPREDRTSGLVPSIDNFEFEDGEVHIADPDEDPTIGGDRTDRKIPEFDNYWEMVERSDIGVNQSPCSQQILPDIKPEPKPRRISYTQSDSSYPHIQKENSKGEKTEEVQTGGRKSSKKKRRTPSKKRSGSKKRKKLTMSSKTTETSVCEIDKRTEKRNRSQRSIIEKGGKDPVSILKKSKTSRKKAQSAKKSGGKSNINRLKGLLVIRMGLVERYTRMIMPPKMRLAKTAIQDLTAIVEIYTAMVIQEATAIARKQDKRGAMKRLDKAHIDKAVAEDQDWDLLAHMMQIPERKKQGRNKV